MEAEKGIIGKDNTNGSGSTNSNFIGDSATSGGKSILGQITIFENVYSKKPLYISMATSFKRIREGASEKLITNIRSIPDKSERDKIKAKLPSLLYSGIFSGREDTNLQKHSGYVVLDFDHVPNLLELKKMVFEEPFILACWLSPSGDGLKAIAKIPEPSKHRLYYNALLKHFEGHEINPDEKNINEARVCYESFDSEILVKESCEPFLKIVEEKKTIQKKRVEISVAETDEEVVYRKLKKWIENKGELFIEGNRNTFLMKFASACNRTGISEISTVSFLSRDYLRDGEFAVKELQQVVSKVYKNYLHQHNTSGFEKKEGVEIISEQTFDAKIEVKDLILYRDVWQNQEEKIEKGLVKGATTHYKILDNHFRWEKNHITIFHGYGNQGKTSMSIQLMLLKSIYSGWKWAVFNKENSPPDDFYRDIAEMYLGATFDNGSSKCPTKEERYRAMEFINDHFFYIYPEQITPTPEYIMKRFMEAIIMYNVDGVVVDPYNQLLHDRGSVGRDDIYLEKLLTTFDMFAQNNKVVFVIVTHPKSPARTKEEGIYPEPTVYDIAGGAMWNNKTNNILCFNRPKFYSDISDTWCTLSSQKIKKQKQNGRHGTVNFIYNRSTSRFYEISNQGDTWDMGYNPMEEKKADEDRKDIELKPSPLMNNYYEVDKDKEDELPF